MDRQRRVRKAEKLAQRRYRLRGLRNAKALGYGRIRSATFGGQAFTGITSVRVYDAGWKRTIHVRATSPIVTLV